MLSSATQTVLAKDDLYTGIVPVTGQGEAERREALPEALRHVLLKLSGERELPASPALEAALARASRSLVAFGYREAVRTLPDGTESTELQLVANFLPSSADDLVRDLGLRRWRVQREPVVLWPVVDDRIGRTLMPPEYRYELDRMAEVAESRGLPVEWPGLPEELMAEVDVQLLWGGYTDQLVGPGSNSQGVAIIAARREGGLWDLRWTYGDATHSNSWRSRAPDLQTALDDGMNELVDLVASLNAIAPSGQGVFSTELLLVDLRGSADYARSLAYLESLGLVEGVEVLSIGPAGLRLKLDLNAEPSYLQGVFRQDGVLEADPSVGAPSGSLSGPSRASLAGSYRLVPRP
ncbi:MAG: DUF2066 domain-containing protein [Xanthomonadales bacterium]|nr:DUF2066 domain-containing protein [Xanthomonadales bacterium]